MARNSIEGQQAALQATDVRSPSTQDTVVELVSSDLVFDEFVPEEFEETAPHPASKPPSSCEDSTTDSTADSSADSLSGDNHRLQVLTPSRTVRRTIEHDDVVTGNRTAGNQKLGKRTLGKRIPEIAVSEDKVTVLGELIRGFKTWGVSFLVHMTVIILLGLLTFGVVTPEIISLTASTIDADEFNTMDMESSFEVSSITESALDDSETLDMPLVTDLDFAEQELAGEFDDSDFGQNMVGADSMFGNIATKGARGPNDKGPSATFYGIKAEGKSFVFVVDRSGSMTGEPWFQAQAELMRSIQSLHMEQEFFIILFNHEHEPMHRMRGRRAKLQTAKENNIKKAQQWVGEQSPIGGTMPKDAVAQALRLKPDVIFLLSDGVFRDGTLEYLRENNALKRVSMGDKKTIVHTIAFKDFVGANLLQQIAHENGGIFKFVQ